jgi:hypothetical protein
MHTARLVALLAASITLAVSSAGAGTGTGTISGFIPGDPNGTAIFVFSTTTTVPGTSPSCNSTQRFAISSTNPTYEITVAAVLEAHATATPVNAVGLGTCTVLGNAEDLNYLCVGSIPC